MEVQRLINQSKEGWKLLATGTAVLFALLSVFFWQYFSAINLTEGYAIEGMLTRQTFYLGLLIALVFVVLFALRKIIDKQNEIRSDAFISKEWFSKTLLGMGEAVITTDKTGKVLSMNKVAEEMTGWTLAEASGKPIDFIFDAVDEESCLSIENPIKKALHENRPILLANHTILIKKDKTQRYIIDSAVPIHNDHSEIIGGALIFRDVTEQSINQKKLEKSEGMLKGIIDNTNLVISITDLEGRYLLVNRQKEIISDSKSSELMGQYMLGDLTERNAREARRTNLEVANEKRLIEYEQRVKHADGTYHIYHTSKFPLCDSDNKVYAVSTISADISEAKKTDAMREKLAVQEIMLKSEIRYDELTENMPNMFFSLNSTLTYTSFNKACEKFTGIAAEQVIGRTVEQAFPEDAPLFSDEFNEVLKSGISKNYVSSFTFRGKTFTYIINIYPTENGISVLMTDLTKQKKAETETLELVDRLQTKNRDLRQFAYSLSHDLRAPIARALGLVSLSRIDSDERINDKSLFENVAEEVANLDHVVRDMNKVISVRAEGKQKQYIDFESELNLIRKVLANEIIKSGAVIISDFHSPAGITTVKNYLYSIMYNLLSNAIKYRSLDRPLTIHVHTRQDSEFIYLTVKDNGMGMDLKLHGEKVFGLYKRFHGDKIDGKGIGLNLVKAQAESLGGKVEVESEVNRGSTFTVYFNLKHT